MLMRSLLFVVVSSLLLSNASAQKWGSIKGKFVYDGTPPKAATITPTKDVAVCGKNKLFEEDLVVHPKNKGIKNIILSLYLKRGAKIDVHPDYAKTAKDKINFDNVACRFEPHVVLVRTSQTLVIGNKDSVGHNTKVDTLKPQNTQINPIIPANKNMDHKFNVAEPLPVSVSCSIHPWMTAKIVVKDNPYMAVTDENGEFEIKNLPAGKHTFQVWQEAAGYVSAVKQDGKKKLSWRRGRAIFEVNAKAETKDLGVFHVAPKVFEK